MVKNKPEHQRAKEWRERLGLTLKQVAELTGYDLKTVWWFEQGRTPRKTATKPWAMQRYRMCCSAIERQFKSKQEFDW